MNRIHKQSIQMIKALNRSNNKPIFSVMLNRKIYHNLEEERESEFLRSSIEIITFISPNDTLFYRHDPALSPIK